MYLVESGNGMGQVATTGTAASQPLQGALPLSTVSPYAAPACAWYQKLTGSGPFTCSFDAASAIQGAIQLPGTYIAAFFPESITRNLTPSSVAIIGLGFWAIAGFIAVKAFQGKR